MRTRPLIPFLIIPWLIGCAHQLPPIAPTLEIQKEDIPVAQKCAPKLGDEPMYVQDSEFMMARDILDAVRLYKADRLVRIRRNAEKDAALRECEGTP